MGSIVSAVYDDMDHYEYLCDLFGEEPHVSPTANGLAIDPYDGHYRELKKRLRDKHSKGSK